jgi:hypothetical protein
MMMIGRSLAALGGILLGIVTLVAPVVAYERPTETRIDLFDVKANRTGAAIIDKTGERVDFYDARSRRTGYGTIDNKGGRIDLYDTRSNRTGQGISGPSKGKR